MNETVLVFGAAGMFGKECVAWLAEKTSWQIVGVDRAECDITDAAAVAACVTNYKPTVIINAAGAIQLSWCEEHPAEAAAINAQGVRNIGAAVAALKKPCRVFHVSTCYIFDDAKDEYTETDEPHPMQMYGQTKLDGERALVETLHKTHHPYFIFRTSWLYAATKASWIDELVQRAQRGESLPLVSDQFNTVTRCRDLTDIMIDFILQQREGDAAGVYHAAALAPHKISKYDIGLFCLRTLGLDEKFAQPMPSANLSVPRPLAARLATIRDITLPDCFASLTTYLHEQYGAKKL